MAQISITPKVGTAINSFAFSTDEYKSFKDSQKSQTGLVAGVGVNVGISESFSVQADLLYTQRGARYEQTTQVPFLGAVTTKGSLRLNYLDIPVLGRYTFGGDDLKFYVNAGPAIGIGLSGKSTLEAPGINFNSNVNFGTEPDNNTGNETYVRRIDFGIQSGAGVLYPVGPGSLNLDLRYSLGLANVDSKPSDVKHRMFVVSLGYQLPIGGK